MATYSASVRQALSSQKDLIDQKEHCSADPDKLEEIGRAPGQQVRVIRNSYQYALYTVSDRQETPGNIVRMGADGRRRLGTSAELAATVDSQVPYRTFITDAEAEERNEFVERLEDNGSHKGLIAIAPHGGEIEPYTDNQAERVAGMLAGKGVSSWRCKGWKDGEGAHERWHITSTDIHPASFPRLKRVTSRGFRFAVAFHGFGGTGVLVGGAAPYSLKREVEDAIGEALKGSGIAIRIAGSDDPLGGNSKQNIVNRLTADGANGIHIEQSFWTRQRYWRDIADAVVSVYKRKLG